MTSTAATTTKQQQQQDDSSGDLFSVLSAMHLTGSQQQQQQQQSRKRKIHGNGTFSGKLNPPRPPGCNNDDNDDDDDDRPLHTPLCSQSGYADDEEDDRQGQLRIRDQTTLLVVHGGGGLMSEIDDNLAADFDGSFSGLGAADVTDATDAASNYSMSEALMALPNLSISNGGFKRESSPANNLGALDVSNDEARFPDSVAAVLDDDDDDEVARTVVFTGDSHSDGGGGRSSFVPPEDEGGAVVAAAANLSGSHPNISFAGIPPLPSTPPPNASKMHKVILPLQQRVKPEPKQPAATATSGFRYTLAAQTSNATKLDEPSITYLNQGQSYELRLKRLGDAAAATSASGRRLLCKVRICFHDRRLRYSELDQLAKWSSEHPGERVLDLDVPLSYGIATPLHDRARINSLSFRWDRGDAAVFVKVNCVSTEFTAKKHGGEKGVPFWLQVETYEEEEEGEEGEEPRLLHVAGCILQVFKLKGADRKHKQDREKIARRSAAEQEKFSPGCDCTVLTEVRSTAAVAAPPPAAAADPSPPPGCVTPRKNQTSREGSPGGVLVASAASSADSVRITAASAPEAVSAWLRQNRLGSYVGAFRNYDGRDLLRLLRDDATALCGLPDGIRLHNALHLSPVASVRTFYVAPRGAPEFSALYLERASTDEFVRRLAASVELPASLFGRLLLVGPGGIVVRVTDEVLERARSETAFRFAFRPSSSSDVCDVLLEDPARHRRDVRLRDDPSNDDPLLLRCPLADEIAHRKSDSDLQSS